MGSNSGHEDKKHSNSDKDRRSSCSSSLKSSSSSRCSSSSSLLLSPSPPTSTGPPSALRSMDDLWQDINLSALQPLATAASSAAHGNVILQDFLGGGGGPFNDDPTPSSRSMAYDPDRSSSSLGSTSGLGLRNGEKRARVRATSQARGHHAGGGVSRACNVCTMRPPSDVHVTPSAAAAAFPPPLRRKSSMENNGGDLSDWRFQRLMKNRESAERSRARKQAYMMEMEIEIGRLHEENDRLRREREQLFFSIDKTRPICSGTVALRQEEDRRQLRT